MAPHLNGVKPKAIPSAVHRRNLPIIRQTQLRGSDRVTDDPVLPGTDDELGVLVDIKRPTMLIGLGTLGCETVHNLIQLVQAETDGRIPPACQFLLLDADAAKPGWDGRHALRLGVDGIGTDASRGREVFLQHWSSLRKAVAGRINRLFTTTTLDQQVGSPLQAVDVWIFGGSGGTSGGFLDPCLTLVHQVSYERGIQEMRTHAVLLGPEMSLRDHTRPLSDEQYTLISANYGSNVVEIVANVQSPATVLEAPPSGPAFPLKKSTRVHTLCLMDRGNGSFNFAVTEEFQRAVAETFFLRIFTPLGSYFASRQRDNLQTRVTGHAHV
jgi:hypothetical protein